MVLVVGSPNSSNSNRLVEVARARGTDWLYGYLTGFYQDASRPFGVNNRVFPNVAMPNVLENLQGVHRHAE